MERPSVAVSRTCSRLSRSIVALLVATGLGISHPLSPLTAAQGVNLQAAVQTGACDSSGNVVADLTGPSVASGEPQGASEGVAAATSYTAAPIALGVLLSEEHSITVTSDGEQVACGALGGAVAPNGSLAVVVSVSNSSDVSGVAFLSPDADNPEATNISLFLIPGTSDTGGSQSAQTADVIQGAEEAAGIDVESVEDVDIDAELTRIAEIPTPTPSPGSSQGNPAPVGTTLTTQGLAVTVDSAYFDYGFANAIPRGGYKVMILAVTLQNTSDNVLGYSAARFSGIDAETGNTYNPVTLDNVGVLLSDGDLQPGEYVSGTALIEVQETATSVIIKYDADFLGDEDLYWT